MLYSTKGGDDNDTVCIREMIDEPISHVASPLRYYEMTNDKMIMGIAA